MVIHQTVPLTILAAGFGALVGSIGTLIARVVIERRKTSQERDMVRNALLSELEAADPLDAVANHLRSSGSLAEVHPDPSAFVSNAVYEGHIDKLGLLEKEERAEVIAYYAHIEAVVPFIEMFNDNRRELEAKAEAVDDEVHMELIDEGIAAVEDGISDAFEQARQNKDDAMQILRQNLHD